MVMVTGSLLKGDRRGIWARVDRQRRRCAIVIVVVGQVEFMVRYGILLHVSASLYCRGGPDRVGYPSVLCKPFRVPSPNRSLVHLRCLPRCGLQGASNELSEVVSLPSPADEPMLEQFFRGRTL